MRESFRYRRLLTLPLAVGLGFQQGQRRCPTSSGGTLHFEVLTGRNVPTKKLAMGEVWFFLRPDTWDDFGYRTSFDLLVMSDRSLRSLGRVKIAHMDQQQGPSPLPVGIFESLADVSDGRWFSVGQDDVYYDNIRMFGTLLASEVHTRLHDLAFSCRPETTPRWVGPRLDSVLSLDVTTVSLLRTVQKQSVRGQFQRIATGGARLTPYAFQYLPTDAAQVLSFSVRPRSNPPSNIHVLIGPNGVGKSTLLHDLALSVTHPGLYAASLTREALEQKGGVDLHRPLPGAIRFNSTNYQDNFGFVNVVSVTFSAFDRLAGQFEIPYEADTEAPKTTNADWRLNRSHPGSAKQIHIGLFKRAGSRGKSHAELSDEFVASFTEVVASEQLYLWHSCLNMLGRDPHVSAAITTITSAAWDTNPTPAQLSELGERFAELSSGHAIVLLTVTQLVQHVAERSLVLIDEPESHLHPPLLASLVQTLSHLLTQRNGVAVIATHSPVVLQEVPCSCVYKLSRWGGLRGERPSIQTYGENVGVLTHEVFGLEVRTSSFHAAIEEAVSRYDSFQEVLNHFNGELGSEGKGLARILLALKSDDESEVS